MHLLNGRLTYPSSHQVITIGAYYIIYPIIYIGIIMMGFGGYSLSMVSYSYLS